jgi:hypothetical protein
MQNEKNSIFRNGLKLSWYMRGGINFTDILNMSHEEIDMINKIIDENLETTKKTKMPFF